MSRREQQESTLAIGSSSAASSNFPASRHLASSSAASARSPNAGPQQHQQQQRDGSDERNTNNGSGGGASAQKDSKRHNSDGEAADGSPTDNTSKVNHTSPANTRANKREKQQQQQQPEQENKQQQVQQQPQQLAQQQQQQDMAAAAVSSSSAAAAARSSIGDDVALALPQQQLSLQQQQHLQQQQQAAAASGGGTGRAWVQQTISLGVSNEPLLRTQLQEKEAKIEELQRRTDSLSHELSHMKRIQAELSSNTSDHAARMARYQEAMMEVMTESARTHRREARRAHHQRQFELGHQTVISTPVGQKEVWVHGNRMRELHAKLDMVSARVNTVETLKSNAERVKRLAARNMAQQQSDVAGAGSGGIVNDDSSNPGFVPDTTLLDTEEEIEMYKQELAALRPLETQLRSELEDAFAAEKIAFLKEKARLQYEDQSDFASVAAIGGGRYVLMYLLGKGGFSEVWRAFDLRDGRHVACKIHRIRREWTQAARDNYMRHARRELDIQRSLDHPRLTKLYDVFEHTSGDGGAPAAVENAFVSVMEYSAGDDLDTHLRKARTMREQDARIVFMQIVSGLRHLAEQKEPIIHYDLKPANIIFHSALSTCLDVKITDFGLSKIVADGTSNEDGHIELTSPGAGTYWYLPPECFVESTSISAKVDIWAAGIIFFQMLYGKRPFAHEDSQRRIWQERLIVTTAQKLEFPDRPTVSQGAKDLIKRCLTFNSMERPDIFALSNDPYLRQPSRRRQRAPSAVPTMLAPAQPLPPTGLEFQVPANPKP